MNNELISIGQQLGQLYRKRADVNWREWQLSQDFDKRRLYLYPQPDGYPGKNAEQRDAARAMVENGDDVLQKIAEQQAANKSELTVIDAQVNELEANRRALEWSIRSDLVSVLAKNHVEISGDVKVEYAAFDDVTDQQILEEAEALSQEAAEMAEAMPDVYEPYDLPDESDVLQLWPEEEPVEEEFPF